MRDYLTVGDLLDKLKNADRDAWIWVSKPAGGECIEMFEITWVQPEGNPAGGAVLHIQRYEGTAAAGAASSP